MMVEYKASNKTEGLLVNALQRLLDGKPLKVKAKGKLTLNRINNEAGLGNSYVHKFKEFVAYAKPVIEKYNLNREKAMATGLDLEVETPLNEIDALKAKFKKVEALKDKYRMERDDAIEARKILEHKYSELMFRAYDMQEELQTKNEVVMPFKR
ncbi:hypothetical protein AB4151_22135 [Vibrio splendidus]|uniref:Uncharacterized protein n=1 Tax=Vibrio splendidus TaxID=29497 RepID=A0A2N7CAP8_VIBSP|nr:hypothetical protein [Vibrio splendidus]PMF18740.1 hypothetical protein BCV19_15165 [Vibrio splendidus]